MKLKILTIFDIMKIWKYSMMKFKRDWSWVFSANSLFRVKIIIICKYSFKKAWEKLNIESGEWKLSLQEENISDSA